MSITDLKIDMSSGEVLTLGCNDDHCYWRPLTRKAPTFGGCATDRYLKPDFVKPGSARQTFGGSAFASVKL